MFSGNVKTALSSLRMSKWRTIFTMMGIIIGVSSVVTIVSLGEGLKHQLTGQVSRLGDNVLTVRPGKLISQNGNTTKFNLLALLSVSNLTVEDVNLLQRQPGVDRVAPINFLTSTVSSKSAELNNIFVAGTDASFADLLRQKVAYGEFFPPGSEEENIAVIGPEVARNLFDTTNAIGHTLSINGQDFIVHGIFERSPNSLLSVAQADFNSSVFVPFQTSLNLTGGRSNIIQIFIRDKRPAPIAKSQVTKLLQKKHGQQDFTVLTRQELLDIAGNLVNGVTGFLTAIAAISLLVGGIGIMDIMLVSVSERTREIGIRKALGATNRQILNQFLVEGLALTVGGGLIGTLLALGINGFFRVYTSWQPVISVPVVLLAVGVSVAVGVIFSVAPALKAARKDPIDALRGN